MSAESKPLGLGWVTLVALAALAVPRAVLHDARVDMGPAALLLLTFGPPAVWVWVALKRRLPSPLLTLVVVGMLYGVALGVVHNLMWESAFGDDEPVLDGASYGELPAAAEAAVLRLSVAFSSVLTGTVVGLVAGLAAMGLRGAARFWPIPAAVRRESRPASARTRPSCQDRPEPGMD